MQRKDGATRAKSLRVLGELSQRTLRFKIFEALWKSGALAPRESFEIIRALALVVAFRVTKDVLPQPVHPCRGMRMVEGHAPKTISEGWATGPRVGTMDLYFLDFLLKLEVPAGLVIV